MGYHYIPDWTWLHLVYVDHSLTVCTVCETPICLSFYDNIYRSKEATEDSSEPGSDPVQGWDHVKT